MKSLLIIIGIAIIILGGLALAIRHMRFQSGPLIDFQNLQLPKEPHYFLVCPKCHGKRQAKSPVFYMPVNELVKKWNQMIEHQPRVKLLKEDIAKQQYQYMQRSLLFRFPDIIDVKFIPLENQHSSLYIYSRSIYGHSDLGVNPKRIKHWLKALKA